MTLKKKIEDDITFYKNAASTTSKYDPTYRAICNIVANLETALTELEMIELNSDAGEAEDRYHR